MRNGEQSRQKLLDAGIRAFHRHGYHATGVDLIARGAKVPKGSFYNHFESKETFAGEVVDLYFERHLVKLRSCMGDVARPPLSRLRAYCDERISFFRDIDCKLGCLLGNLGLEASDHSEEMRERIAGNLDIWSGLFRALIEEAQTAGHLDPALPSRAMADFVLNSWEGAILRMKVCRDVRPLEEARDFIFDRLLK